MSVRRWVHLGVMLVPVAILTVLNVAGIEPSERLVTALAALTATAAAVVGPQVMQARVDTPPRRRKAKHDAPRDQQQSHRVRPPDP